MREKKFASSPLETGTGCSRDIQRLPTTPFGLVLRKEYFDGPQRDSHAVQLHLKSGEMGVCTLVLCRLATVTSCHRRLGADSDKISEGRTSILIFSISLGCSY